MQRLLVVVGLIAVAVVVFLLLRPGQTQRAFSPELAPPPPAALSPAPADATRASIPATRAHETVHEAELRGSIRGEVRDAGGGIPAGTVVLVAGPERRTTAVDEDGRFVLRGLRFGRYDLTAAALGYGSGTAQVSLSSEAREAVVSFGLVPRSGIRGVVLSPEAEPVRGAVVLARAPDGKPERSPRASSGSDGRFFLDVGAEAAVHLRALHREFAPSELLPASPDGPEPVVLRLRPAAGLSARLVDETTREPLPGARLRASLAGGINETGRWSAASRDPGLASVTGLAPGRYVAELTASGYLPRRAPEVELAEGEARDLGDVPLARGGVFVGTVVDAATGEALHDVGVLAVGSGSAPSVAARTDRQGTFELEPLEPGFHRLTVQKLGYDVAELPSASVEAGRKTTLPTVRLKRRAEAPTEQLGSAHPGIRLGAHSSGPVVRGVVPGSAAEETGLVAGMRLVKVAGYATAVLDMREVMTLLSGEAGTAVKVEVGGTDGSTRRVLELQRR